MSRTHGEASGEIQEEVGRRAQALHTEMRDYWNQQYEGDYGRRLLHHLSLLLFEKRKCAESAEGGAAGAPQPCSDYETTFASQDETARTILSVLRVRHEYLLSQNITDFRRVLTEDQRGELEK
eukprot:6071338-Pyramimonas_sp.AAC.1